MFEEMMQAREKLPLFSGDNIFYFMQKSHYFLHPANGETPDTFADRAPNARAARARGPRTTRGPARPGGRSLAFRYPTPFGPSHAGARRAPASSPDLRRRTRGRGAPPLERKGVPLDPGQVEFVELRDGGVVLEALLRAGGLGEFLEAQRARGASEERFTACASSPPSSTGSECCIAPRTSLPAVEA